MPSYSDIEGSGTHRAPGEGGGRLQEIKGMVPSLYELPAGCKFQDRCDAVKDKCRAEEPELVALGDTIDGQPRGQVRCHFPVEVSA